MNESYTRKYNTATAAASHVRRQHYQAATLNFATDANWTPAAGDVLVSKDGGTTANIATLPSYVNGSWQYEFSATELSCGVLMVKIEDAAIDDDGFVIETYGNASALVEWDYDKANPTVDAVAISGDTTAADNLETMLDGTGGQVLSLGQLNVVNSTGSAIVATSSGSNGHGMILTGNGTGHGLSATGGSTGIGMLLTGGSASGAGLSAQANGSGSGILASGSGANGHGLSAVGAGTGRGINANGGNTGGGGPGIYGSGGNGNNGIMAVGFTTGNGLHAVAGSTGHGFAVIGGSTSGNGIHITTTDGDGVNVTATGTSQHGVVVTGGTAGTSDGFKAVAGTGGVDIRGAITGDVTGNLSGSVGSVTAIVTANTTQISGDSTAADNLETAYDDTAGSVPWTRIVDQGTAQSATGTTLVLRAAAGFADDELNGATVTITGGTTGVGQSRVITDYVGATDTATVDTWATTPTGTIAYKITGTATNPTGVPSSVNVTQWNGTAVATPTVAGVPEVDVTHWRGTAVPAEHTAGYPVVTVKDGTGTGELDTASGGVIVATDGITSGSLASTAIAEIADGVWDEAAGGHITIGTFGQVHQPIRSSTAQGGTATGITLDSGASAVNDFYNDALIQITSGLGVGQSRFITDYDGTTKVASVDTWATNPDSSSQFVILPFGAIAGATAPTSAEVADAVWNELRADHLVAGSFGEYVMAAVDTFFEDVTVTANFEAAYDGTGYAGGTILPNVNVENWNATAVPAEHTAGYPIVTIKDGTGTGEIDTASGKVSLSASGSIPVGAFATGAITADAIATDAIGAAELAADAVTEIATGVWDRALTTHTTADTAGRCLFVLDSISDRTNNPTLNAILGVSDTASRDLPEQTWLETARTLTAATNLTSTGSAIVLHTDNKALLAGTTHTSAVVPTVTDVTNIVTANTTQIEGVDATDTLDARIAAQVVVYGLDHLVSASVAGTDIADNSIIAKLVSASATADWDSFSNLTDSLEALRNRGDAAWTTGSTLTQADIRTAVGLASANLDTQLTTIDDFLDTEVTAIKAKTDLLTFTGTDVKATLDSETVALSATGFDAVLVGGIAGSVALDIIAASAIGIVSGAGSGTEVFKSLNKTTTRATVTVDSSGNRTAITYGV